MNYKEILLRYINDPADNLALQLNAHWGAGKTHFVSEFIKEQKASKGSEKGGKIFVYVSLNGLNTVDAFKSRLNERLIAELIAKEGLKNSGLKLFKKANDFVSSGGMALLLNLFDTNSRLSDVERASKNFSGNMVQKMLQQLSQNGLVLIVDDFERLSGGEEVAKSILGEVLETYMRGLQAKVILVSSDKNIHPSDNTGQINNLWFDEIREKYVGTVIRYETDYVQALTEIASENIKLSHIKMDSKVVTTLLEPLQVIGRFFNRQSTNGLVEDDTDTPLRNLRHLERGIRYYISLFGEFIEQMATLKEVPELLWPRLQEKYLPMVFALAVLNIEGKINIQNVSELQEKHEPERNSLFSLDESTREEHKLWDRYADLAEPLAQEIRRNLSKRSVYDNTQLLPALDGELIV
ncbi:MAG: KAP family NTPase, partial [Lactobacillaceae bacterium]|nr:KAP family NTPase [Lactobacillaceae bacterium]